MSEKLLRNVFIFGTLGFLVILAAMTVNSLSQVMNARTPQVTDQVVAGKILWQDRNCNDCHTILGIGAYFAPELTKVVHRRDPAWVLSFLQDPQAAKPGTTMPNQKLTAAQAENLVSFFQWVGQIDTNNWPPEPVFALGGAGDSTELSGALVFQQKGCSACHMVNGQGAAGPGPDLSRIATQPYADMPNTPEFLDLWLEDPAAQKPGTTMPALPLSESERHALVNYLTTLK